MSRDKIITLIGVSDEEAAHLRLLMRKCVLELDNAWRWGEEDTADLVVVDRGSFGGQMARSRALNAGVRCAVFADGPVDDVDLVFLRPLMAANVVDVLNRASHSVVTRSEIGVNSADFYSRELGDEDSSAAERPDNKDAPVDGLDRMLRPEPTELRAAPSAAAQRAAIEASSGAQAPLPIPAPQPSTSTAASQAHVPVVSKKYASRASMLIDTTPHDLRTYLEGDVLNGCARFTLDDAPQLVLDPKNRVAYARVGLRGLEPYCHASWRPCDWQPMTSSELVECRRNDRQHSYTRLLWMNALVHSNGYLASHLDPGGTYRIKQWLEIDKDFGKYFRIASAMLKPARLHDIAAASDSPMADVFDLVNAFDAIDMLEWQPRAPRHKPVKPMSLFDRLRNPFGRS